LASAAKFHKSGTEESKMSAFESVLAGKYPAKAHARRVVEYIRKTNPNATGVLYLEGQKTQMIEDSDETMPFRYGIPAPGARQS
jgi:Xaa-Pro dipeptidase